MNKLLGDKLIKEKQTIRNRYIAGESVPSIAKSYDVTERNIYYHLGTLTPKEKGLHSENSSLRKMTIKKDPVKRIPKPKFIKEVSGRVEVCGNFSSAIQFPDMCAGCGYEYQDHLNKIKEDLKHA